MRELDIFKSNVNDLQNNCVMLSVRLLYDALLCRFASMTPDCAAVAVAACSCGDCLFVHCWQSLSPAPDNPVQQYGSANTVHVCISIKAVLHPLRPLL